MSKCLRLKGGLTPHVLIYSYLKVITAIDMRHKQTKPSDVILNKPPDNAFSAKTKKIRNSISN